MRIIIVFLFAAFMNVLSHAGDYDYVADMLVAKVLGIASDNTILVERLDQPGTKIKIHIRGIQLADQNGACDFEKNYAKEAAEEIKKIIDGHPVILQNAAPGPSLFIANADIVTHNGIIISQHLIDNGLGHSTDTGTRADWCGE